MDKILEIVTERVIDNYLEELMASFEIHKSYGALVSPRKLPKHPSMHKISPASPLSPRSPKSDDEMIQG